jgi:hypothetical protein
MQHHVFLSYSRKDTATMTLVRDKLRADGLSVWTDENLTPGTPEWEPIIEGAIREAGCVIALLSPDFKESKWCAIELATADDLKRTIFPLLVRGSDADAIPLRLRTTQRVNAVQNLDAGVQKTAEAVCRHLSIESNSMRERRLRDEEARRLAEQQRRQDEARKEQERQRKLADEAEIKRLQEIEQQRLRQEDEIKRQAHIQEEARKRAERAHRRLPRAIGRVRNGCLVLLVLGAVAFGVLLVLSNQQQQRRFDDTYDFSSQGLYQNSTTQPTSEFNSFIDFGDSYLLHIGCDEVGGGGFYPVGSTITLYENIVGATPDDALALNAATSFATYINGSPVSNWSQSGPNLWNGNIPGYGSASGYTIYYSAPATLQSAGTYYSSTTFSRIQDVFNGFLTYFAGTYSTSCTFSAS